MAGKNKDRYVIIMAGGVGSRFWPVSRTSYPKQFLDILGTGTSLLQQTYKRFQKQFLKENIFIVANEQYRGLITEQIPGIDQSKILGEPLAKNTTACIAYAAFHIHKLNPAASCIVAPSDHLILDEPSFFQSVDNGFDFLKTNDALLTLGIKPSRPDTGYGYIQYIDSNHPEVKKVKTFTEKPSIEIAQTFIDSGDFLWNAGIFIWNNAGILGALEKYSNELYSLFKETESSLGTDNEKPAITEAYELCKNISIDYAVMEKADNVFVIPSDFGWSDLGTWASLYSIHDKDEKQNAVNGKLVFNFNTNSCMVHAPNGKLVVLNSVNDLIVVDTEDVLLVCNRNREQEVKQIVTDIKLKFGEKYI